MLRLIGNLISRKRLLKEFVARDLQARYVGSSMGFFWSVVFPILNLFVYMFVFRVVLNTRWSDAQGASEVSLVMLGGIVVWAAFAETISRSTNTLVENANLIQKVVFPSEVLPMFLSVSSLINMCIGLPVVIIGVAWFAYFAAPDANFKLPAKWNDFKARGEITEIYEADGAFEARIVLANAIQLDSTFPFTVEGTATEGEDYRIATPSPITLPADSLDVCIRIDLLTDSVEEGDETLTVRLGEPENAQLSPSPGPDGHDKAPHRLTYVLKDSPAGEESRPYTPLKPLRKWTRESAKSVDSAYRPMKLGITLVLLPLLFGLQVLFTVGLGYFLSTLNLFLRDVYHLIGVGITVWMFGTPIFYPAHMVIKAGYGWMLQLNPMYWLIDSYRDVMIYGVWPDWTLVIKFAVAGVLVFAIGSSFFSRQKHQFPDLL